jgi:hypothetical protein
MIYRDHVTKASTTTNKLFADVFNRLGYSDSNQDVVLADAVDNFYPGGNAWSSGGTVTQSKITLEAPNVCKANATVVAWRYGQFDFTGSQSISKVYLDLTTTETVSIKIFGTDSALPGDSTIFTSPQYTGSDTGTIEIDVAITVHDYIWCVLWFEDWNTPYVASGPGTNSYTAYLSGNASLY